MFSETTFLLVFGLGALCMLLGFFLVVRGVGASDSESAIKLIGIEVRASRVGPGVLFAMFGVVLIVTALSKQPGPPGQVQAQAAPQPAPAAPTTNSPPANTAQPPITTAATGSVEDAVAQSGEVESEPVSNAAPPVPRQQREAQLIAQFLGEAAQGGCNPRILGPAPLANCQQALPVMQGQLLQAGPVVNVAYATSVQTPLGVADRFVVTHSIGSQVVWSGILGADGRFVMLGSP